LLHNFSDGVTSRWKRTEQAIAQGIDWIMAKMQGLDPNEMARTISEDYNRQSRLRESEKEGTLDIFKQDFENAAGIRNAAYETKRAAQEAEIEKAKVAYNEAINHAKIRRYIEFYNQNAKLMKWNFHPKRENANGAVNVKGI
jgi:hypothetical protein